MISRRRYSLRICFFLALAITIASVFEVSLITPVAATFSFRMMLNPNLGVINHLMKAVGLPPQAWLAAPETPVARRTPGAIGRGRGEWHDGASCR